MKIRFRDLIKGTRRGLEKIFSPAPSCFDFLISLMLVINFIKTTYIKEIFFIFYTLFLWCISLMIKPKRNYTNIWLVTLLIWSLISVFIHSYLIYTESIIFRYKNMYLMSEGFIYILCGVMFLNLLIKYSTNLKFLYLLIPILSMPWFFEFSVENHLTPIFALAAAILIYSIIKKIRWCSILMMWIGIIYFGLNYQHILNRFRFKIPVMKALVLQIINHPFIGNGFNKTLNYDNMIFLQDKQLWLWRYNDFLNIGSYLGIIGLICAIMFVYGETVKLSGIKLVITFAMILIMSFQSIMFFVDKAVAYLFITGLFIYNTEKA